jgi:hypothetical protein
LTKKTGDLIAPNMEMFTTKHIIGWEILARKGFSWLSYIPMKLKYLSQCVSQILGLVGKMLMSIVIHPHFCDNPPAVAADFPFGTPQ